MSTGTRHIRRSLPKGHYRIEAYRRTEPTLPVPAYSLLEQYRGAGSPSDPAPSQNQSGVPVIRVGVANHSRHRDHAHDPKRPSEGGYPRTTSWDTPCSLRLPLECPWLRDEETSTFVCSLSNFATLRGYIPPGSYLANRCLTEREKRD